MNNDTVTTRVLIEYLGPPDREEHGSDYIQLGDGAACSYSEYFLITGRGSRGEVCSTLRIFQLGEQWHCLFVSGTTELLWYITPDLVPALLMMFG